MSLKVSSVAHEFLLFGCILRAAVIMKLQLRRKSMNPVGATMAQLQWSEVNCSSAHDTNSAFFSLCLGVGGSILWRAMSFFKSLKRLYALETLDTRFTSSTKTPPADPARAQPLPDGIDKQTGLPPGARPSLWNTSEFYLYYLVIGAAVPLMFNSVYQVSKRKQAPFYVGTSTLITVQLHTRITRTMKSY